jgi:segregation and condensation protein B
MSLPSKLEAILFVASKPLTIKKLVDATEEPAELIRQELNELAASYNQEGSGINLLNVGEEWQMVAASTERAATEQFLKAEISGELTRPQLETLTVISYCGPITKPELEQVRGVNCSLILRNLLMRGLVKEAEDSTALLPAYSITIDYLRALGIERVEDLPSYTELHRHDYLAKALKTNDGEESGIAATLSAPL